MSTAEDVTRLIKAKQKKFENIMDEIASLYQYIQYNKPSVVPYGVSTTPSTLSPGPYAAQETEEQEVFAALPPPIPPQYVR
jgi:hypothetical protein